MTPDPVDAAARARAQRRRTASVLLTSALLGVLGAALALPVVRWPAAHDGVQVPWELVVVLFAGAELVVMNVQYQREARTVSLSELPLVLCLVFAAPLHLLVGRVLGVMLVYAGHRRGSAVKNTFNTALLVAETALAVGVFHLVAGDPVGAGPRAWLAALVAVGLEQLLAFAAISRVVAVYEGRSPWPVLLRALRDQLVLSTMITVVALVAVASLLQDARNLVLLVAAGGVVVLAYRAYTSLFDRHLSLERLYGFSQVLGSTPEVDEVLVSVLGEAQQMLRAEHAEVLVLSGRSDGRALRVGLDAGGRLRRDEVEQEPAEGWLRDQLVRDGRPVLLGRGGRDPQHRELLARRGWGEAILVPLRGTSGVFGTLCVADRMGEVRAFDEQDVQLLETVANHASVAVQNGRLIDRLRHDALHDALTGLPNRALFRQLLDAALEVAAGRPGTGVAAMVLDLDGFKDVNDTLGHAMGDELLREVAARLTSAVGRAGTVARLGGDEFAVLLPVCGDEEAVLRVARRALHAFGQPVELEQQEVEVGASIGVALAPQHGTDAATLLKRADLAMYGAKASTGGLRVFEPALDATSERRLTLVAELRHALHAGELTVHVQPQADLVTHEVRAAEALLRWSSPRLGTVSPEEFVPVAERSGLIGGLTSFVLDRSLEAVASWRAQGCELAVAVNLSTRSLLDADLVDEVQRLLARHDVPGRLLTLEVTESSVMADPARAVALLHALRGLGVRLSVDDFGTGYSSLSYLKRLPVHEVKVDKSFVLDLPRSPDDEAIVGSIVALGRHLGLDVVAEGVEDDATWRLLRAMGCTTAQGYRLARPMPVDALVPWLRQRTASVPLRVVG